MSKTETDEFRTTLSAKLPDSAVRRFSAPSPHEVITTKSISFSVMVAMLP